MPSPTQQSGPNPGVPVILKAVLRACDHLGPRGRKRHLEHPRPVARVLSQSAGLGAAILELACRRAIGVSSFVSVGNKADLSGNDLLLYWEQDVHTAVAALYLESFGNPRRFARIAIAAHGAEGLIEALAALRVTT